MKTGGCSVRTMGGLSMAQVHVSGSRRHQQRVLRAVPSTHRGHALPSSQAWSPRGFSSCGLMRRDGRKRQTRNPPCMR